MQTEYNGIVDDVFCEVIEKLAFMFGDPTDKEELTRQTSDFSQVSMNFSGELDGSLTLLVPSEMCTEIASSVLGVEPDDELAIEQAFDALKELLNVTCGQLLTAIAGDEPIFDLSVPETSKQNTNDWHKFKDKQKTIGFMVDDYPVLLELNVMKGKK